MQMQSKRIKNSTNAVEKGRGVKTVQMLLKKEERDKNLANVGENWKKKTVQRLLISSQRGNLTNAVK